MSNPSPKAGKLLVKGKNKSLHLNPWESPLELGDGLDQPYQNTLKWMNNLKAKKTYCPPEDDVIVVGSRGKSIKK